MSLFSFLIGAGIGATSTYLYKDQAARQCAIETSKSLKTKAGELVCSIREKIAAKKNDDTTQPTAAASS